ncbi:MAG: hypothetical protein NTV25_06555 [Methanothrix sp.]|nr:hypothetical protein [Methanothrix sp.]
MDVSHSNPCPGYKGGAEGMVVSREGFAAHGQLQAKERQVAGEYIQAQLISRYGSGGCDILGDVFNRALNLRGSGGVPL